MYRGTYYLCNYNQTKETLVSITMVVSLDNHKYLHLRTGREILVSKGP